MTTAPTTEIEAPTAMDLSALLANPRKPPSRRRKGHSRRGSSAPSQTQKSHQKRRSTVHLRGPTDLPTPPSASLPMSLTAHGRGGNITVVDDVVIIRDSSVESVSIGSSTSSAWSDVDSVGSMADFIESDRSDEGDSGTDDTEESDGSQTPQHTTRKSTGNSRRNESDSDRDSASDDSYQCVDQPDGTQIAYSRNRRKNIPWTRSGSQFDKKDHTTPTDFRQGNLSRIPVLIYFP